MNVQNARAAARARELQEERDGMWLVERGWFRDGKEWRHKRLVWPWPTSAARRLQEETDNGSMDPAHRLLRGKDGPP